MSESYRGNENLKGANTVEYLESEEWTRRTTELVKCKQDILYFASTYYLIVNLDRGKEIINMYDKQAELVKRFSTNRRNIVLASRQSGKCLLGNTKVKIRNKKTHRIEEITLKQFHEKIKNKRFPHFRLANIINKIKRKLQSWNLFVKNVDLLPKEKNH